MNSPPIDYQHVIYRGRVGTCHDRLLIRWDLSSLPENVQITGATIYLRFIQLYGSQSGRMVYYRILEDWDETDVDFETEPEYTEEDAVFCGWTPAPDVWHSVDIIGFVQQWHEDSTTNFGIYGTSVDEIQMCVAELRSSETGDREFRPKLYIFLRGVLLRIIRSFSVYHDKGHSNDDSQRSRFFLQESSGGRTSQHFDIHRQQPLIFSQCFINILNCSTLGSVDGTYDRLGIDSQPGRHSKWYFCRLCHPGD